MAILHPSLKDRLASLAEQFQTARPFRHVVIDDFFSDETLEGLIREFPSFGTSSGLKTEYGGHAKKGARNDVRSFGHTYRLVDDYVSSDEFREIAENVTGFEGLLYDPEYYGAGIHENFEGPRNHVHIDYNYHPKTGYHRRLNAIVYLNPEWREEFGGAITLYEDGYNPESGWRREIPPLANRCVLFETNEHSWHGVQSIVLPPSSKHLTRRSFTIYMYSQDRPQGEVAPRHETIYLPGPRPEFIRAGHELSEQDVQRLVSYMRASKQLTRALYTRETDFWRRLTALRERVATLEGNHRPRVVGFARLLEGTCGIRADDWVLQKAEVHFEALAPIDRIEVDATYPSNHPLPANFRLIAGGSCEVATVTNAGPFSLTLKIALEAGERALVRLECDRATSPAAAGYGADATLRSYRLDEMRLVPRTA